MPETKDWAALHRDEVRAAARAAGITRVNDRTKTELVVLLSGGSVEDLPVRAPSPAPTTQVDLSEFFRLSRPKKKPCSVGFARTLLAPSEQFQLDAACAADKGIITAQAVVDWLARRKQETNTSAVANHRRGACSCGDE